MDITKFKKGLRELGLLELAEIQTALIEEYKRRQDKIEELNK